MASLSFDAFFRAIRKGEIPGAVYLHGPEDVLKDEAVSELLDQTVDPSLRDFNVDRCSAATLDPEHAETLCNTLPMMAERRVVIIRDIEVWNRRARAKAAVLRYLERPGRETVLILVQGAGDSEVDKELAAKTTVIAAEPLPPERATRWLEREAQKLGVLLAPDAAAHMVRVADADLGILKSELAKLSGLAGGEALPLERVSDLLGVRHGETQYDWRDLVLAGRTARALDVLPHVLAQAGVSGVSLVSLLGTAFAGLGLARAHLDRGSQGGTLVQAVKRSLFRARPARLSYDAAANEWSGLARAWPRERINRALRLALQADTRLKTTTLADERAVLVDLVLNLGLAWQKAA